MHQPFVQIATLDEAPARQPTFVAVGSFDGVHRGHQAVLQNMIAAARQQGMRTAVLTFFPHPKRVVQGLNGRYYLATLEERVHLLAQQGIDLIITHTFDDIVRHTRAADFIDQLCHHLDMRQLWGGNFALGYRREGDVPFLQQLGQAKGYTVELVAAMEHWQGKLVSSSRIRHALTTGDIATANGCLGRPFQLIGTVTHGDQRGHTIGFPTANLAVWEEQMLPAYGVYATYAWVGQRRYPAATNIGVRPTVDGLNLRIEAHLLDFSGDLYDQQIRLDFIGHIRPEMKFAGLDALKSQIAADIAAIRQQLGQE